MVCRFISDSYDAGVKASRAVEGGPADVDGDLAKFYGNQKQGLSDVMTLAAYGLSVADYRQLAWEAYQEHQRWKRHRAQGKAARGGPPGHTQVEEDLCQDLEEHFRGVDDEPDRYGWDVAAFG